MEDEDVRVDENLKVDKNGIGRKRWMRKKW